jgi:putative ABC transport system permease protein
VAGDYFRTLGIPLLRGRDFEASDGAGSPPVAIVNEALANGFWPGADPIGKRMRLGGSDNPWTTVVGVVGGVSQRSLAEGRLPMFYQSIAQSPWVDGMYLVVRSSVPSDGTVAALRRVVADLDPSLPLTDVAVSTEMIAESVREPRFRAVVLAIFGLSAVIVAVAGVYGVVAYAVSVRRRELGIRIALGAAPTGLVAHVLRDGISLALVGLVIGVGGAVALSRFLRGLLYGIGPLDAATFGVVVTVVAAVTAVACYLPARRAAAADPLESMRME